MAEIQKERRRENAPSSRVEASRLRRGPDFGFLSAAKSPRGSVSASARKSLRRSPLAHCTELHCTAAQALDCKARCKVAGRASLIGWPYGIVPWNCRPDITRLAPSHRRTLLASVVGLTFHDPAYQTKPQSPSRPSHLRFSSHFPRPLLFWHADTLMVLVCLACDESCPLTLHSHTLSAPCRWVSAAIRTLSLPAIKSPAWTACLGRARSAGLVTTFFSLLLSTPGISLTPSTSFLPPLQSRNGQGGGGGGTGTVPLRSRGCECVRV